MKFSIDTSDKPNLERAMKQQPELAKEVIQTFASLMDEAFNPDKGITWADLPKELFKTLTFRQLMYGILRGSLDCREINPEAFDALKVEVHPLSHLSDRRNALDNAVRYARWRSHFKIPDTVPVGEEAIALIFRKILRYTRFIDVDALKEAHDTNQIASFRGLGERAVANLPFMPALRFQQKRFGDLHVGKMFDEIGSFDCGEMPEEVAKRNVCPACEQPLMHDMPHFKMCLSCNAGFKKEGVRNVGS